MVPCRCYAFFWPRSLLLLMCGLAGVLPFLSVRADGGRRNGRSGRMPIWRSIHLLGPQKKTTMHNRCVPCERSLTWSRSAMAQVSRRDGADIRKGHLYSRTRGVKQPGLSPPRDPRSRPTGRQASSPQTSGGSMISAPLTFYAPLTPATTRHKGLRAPTAAQLVCSPSPSHSTIGLWQRCCVSQVAFCGVPPCSTTRPASQWKCVPPLPVSMQPSSVLDVRSVVAQRRGSWRAAISFSTTSS